MDNFGGLEIYVIPFVGYILHLYTDIKLDLLVQSSVERIIIKYIKSEINQEMIKYITNLQ